METYYKHWNMREGGSVPFIVKNFSFQSLCNPALVSDLYGSSGVVWLHYDEMNSNHQFKLGEIYVITT
jgi:hypothetical protein